IEDCAVPLQHLAEYSDGLVRIFQRHGVRGTFYGHASVGCLHVRPVLDLKQEAGVRVMRAIAEETHELVRRFGGSHSGEHGDGILRSEFIEPMLGKRLAAAFEEVKHCFDPQGLFNPGRIVRPPRMDDRSLFRYPPGYGPSQPIETALDWSDRGGLLGAVEMCNNNGACRKLDAEVMCPSYRATRDERDLTRGRANALRLALTGQLGPEAFTSDEMYRTLDLCISCKACRRECPMGVDMARMKIEFLSRYRQQRGISLRDRLVAYLPRYAPFASRLGWLLNLRNRSGALSWLGERLTGLSAQRKLPRWQPRRLLPSRGQSGDTDGAPVVLLPDTFNTYFEPENLSAAHRVLQAAGCSVIVPGPPGERPLCCGRTFLSMGLVEEARQEARRTLDALKPWVEEGIPIVGLEPSCLLTLRDEIPALFPGREASRAAGLAVLFEEYLSAQAKSGQLALDLGRLPVSKVLVHGHCHQKAFGAMPAVLDTLQMVPGLEVQPIESSCCGMAGSFGYEADHYEVSMKIAELSLLPAVRQADQDTWIAADGFSCRHQIRDGAGRPSFHVARILAAALPSPRQDF
ncbi:MAG: FAD-linked oxidase C-terminal domain-containing protein, partial [Acidobacteriota bacterium]